MKIESSLSNKSLILIQGCLFTFISLLFLKSLISSYILVGIVGFVFLGLLIFKFPNLVFPLFIVSLFWGNLYYRDMEFGVTISDPIFLLLLVGYVCALLNPNTPRLRNDKTSNSLIISFSMLIAFLILSLLVNASNLPGSYIFYGAVKSAYMIQYLLAFVIVSTLYLPDKGKDTLRLIYLLSLLQLPIAMYQFVFSGGISGTVVNRDVLGSMSYHHGMLGTFMLIPFFLSIGQARIAERKILKISYIGMSVIFFILVILSGTRSALLGLFVAVAIFLVTNLKWKRSNMKYMALTVIAAIAVYFLTPVKLLVQATFHEGSSVGDSSSWGRLLIWKGAWDYFTHADLLHKFFGAGFGGFFLIPQSQVVFNGLRHSFGAHNNLLNVLCETGLAGLTAFTVFFTHALSVLYKRKHPLALSFFYATIAMLFSGLTQETFWVTNAFHNLWLFYMVIFALVLKISNVQELK